MPVVGLARTATIMPGRLWFVAFTATKTIRLEIIYRDYQAD
jgi:hypothetical protein